MIKIVSDSSTLYSPSQAHDLGFELSPLFVNINDESFREYVSIDSQSLISKINAGAIPTSSQPPIGEKIELYNRYEKEGVIDITIADGLSGTYNTAVSAQHSSNNPEAITVFNSQTLCAPHRYLVEEALKMAKDNCSKDAIIKMLEQSIKTEVSFLIPVDFDFLKRGGRISKAVAGLGNLLHLIICMRKSDDGKVLEKHSISRTVKKAAASIIEELKKRHVDTSFRLAIAHADNEKLASKIKQELVETFNTKVDVFDLSPAFIVQGGPGCCAVQAIKIIR